MTADATESVKSNIGWRFKTFQTTQNPNSPLRKMLNKYMKIIRLPPCKTFSKTSCQNTKS